MGYVGNQTTNAYTSITKQDLTGVTGSPVKRGFTLDHAVANANEIEVFVNNVRQEPSVAYTVSGTALTMTGDVETTDDFYVVFQGKAIQTVVPPDLTVDTAKIKDDAVTSAKIADDAVTTDKIADDAVTAAKISTVDYSSFRNPIAFEVKNNDTGAYITTSPVPFNNKVLDLGNNFDATTDYDFTCPVDGIYSFTFNNGIVKITGSGGYIYTYLTVNGTGQGYQYDQYNSAGTYSNQSRTYILSLSANDKVDVRVTASSAQYYNGTISLVGYLIAET